MNNKQHVQPWYKEIWAWVIIALPLSVIIGCIFTVSIAFKNADTVVDSDLQSRGITAEAQLEQEHRAKQLGLSIDISIDREKGDVNLVLNHNKLSPLPNRLTLRLTHATLPKFDQEIMLEKGKDNHYHGTLNNFYSGFRYLSLLPVQGDWELKGSIELFSQQAQHV